jgi:hypothetical protein
MSENNKKNKTIIDFKKEKKAYEKQEEQIQKQKQEQEPDQEPEPEPDQESTPESTPEYTTKDDSETPNDDKLNDWFKYILKNKIFYPRTSFYIGGEGGNLRFPPKGS